MNTKFRVWLKEEKCFAGCIDLIRFFSKKIFLSWGEIHLCDCFDFEDVEFLQTTGTFDKAGKEIFEGDVLQIDCIKAIVRFGKYRYHEEKEVLSGNGFYLECLNVIDPDCISPYEPDVLGKAEIIGNIFENPTLEYHFIGLRPK